METREELIAKLQKAKAIMSEIDTKKRMAEKDLDNGGCANSLLGLIAGSVVWCMMFIQLDMNFIISSVAAIVTFSLVLSFFAATQPENENKEQALRILHTEIPQLQARFQQTYGFSIHQYTPSQIDQIIQLLESGEADTMKEALFIIRTINNHNELMAENRKLEAKLEETNTVFKKEMKKMEQKNSQLKSKVNSLESEVDDFHRYH